MKYLQWAVGIAILVSLILIYIIMEDPGEETCINCPLQGEVWGNLLINGSIKAHDLCAFREFSIKSYGLNNNYTRLVIVISNLSSVRVVETSSGYEFDREYPVPNGTMTIETREGHVVTNLHETDIVYDYTSFEGVWYVDTGYRIRSNMSSITGTARLEHNGTKEFDVDLFRVTLHIGNDSVELRNGGLILPDDRVCDLAIDFRGSVKVLPMPDVEIDGTLTIEDFREVRDGKVVRRHDVYTLTSERIVLRTVQRPHMHNDHGHEYLDPWVVEIAYDE